MVKWSVTTSTYSCPTVPFGIIFPMMLIPPIEKGHGKLMLRGITEANVAN